MKHPKITANERKRISLCKKIVVASLLLIPIWFIVVGIELLFPEAITPSAKTPSVSFRPSVTTTTTLKTTTTDSTATSSFTLKGKLWADDLGLTLENRDTKTWRQCKLTVNDKFEYKYFDVYVGEDVRIRKSQLTAEDGMPMPYDYHFLSEVLKCSNGYNAWKGGGG